MTSTLSQYKGALSPHQAAKGIVLARANARRLLSDAQLLLESKRHASASALAILAIEELGKVQAIKIIVLQREPAKLKEAWRAYRNHRAKNVQWILPKLAAEGARTLAQLRAAADPAGDHTGMLDSIKQLALYTDCYGDTGRWSEPNRAIATQFASSITATARMLDRETRTTERELELWVAIVGPHYGKPTMVNSLLAFQKQIFDEGISSISADETQAFVTGNPSECGHRPSSIQQRKTS